MKRPSATQRGYGVTHRRWRKMVLARHPVCCWPGCNEPATEADHINGDNTDVRLENGQGLCKPCHSRKTAQDHHPKGCSADGTPLDPGHHWHGGGAKV